ncbi:DUF4132 domain-containing protein [Actinomadura sp. 21ATH]|uniref:DUF4132 domain-containing protein n=1 Tax=Actinomadura sp. 21ATH TaxID=1735444 RepID=UPI0035BF0626
MSGTADGLGDEELATLLPEAYAGGLFQRTSLQEEFAARPFTVGPGTCERLYASLVFHAEERDRDPDLRLGLSALLRCEGPLPDGIPGRARALVRYVLDRRDPKSASYALLGTAALAGPDAYREVVERLTSGDGAIRADELAWLEGWGAETVEGFALLSEVGDKVWNYQDWFPSLRDAWKRLAGRGYLAFSRRALEAAEARVAAIHSGEIPFRADKAFTSREVAILGRAARLALERDEPWLPDLLDRLLRGVAVAPSPDVRNLPSQALLFELARAAEEVPTPELVTALREARGIVRHAGVRKQLDRKWKKIDAALAERADVALRLPDLGFAPDGTRTVRLGEYEAVITVGAGGAEPAWRGPGGKPLKSVPAAVRRDHGPAVKELRELVKRTGVHLATLARVLEGGLPGEVAMPYGEWRDRLGAHPVAAAVARRLIWEAETAPGEWRAWLPAEEEPVCEDAAAPVRLWHPIRATVDEVRAWRDLITERRVRQPFKQAFREIYLLTPAEEETGTYSNRYAGHLLRYKQLFALFRGRGWTSRMLGPWDGGQDDVAHRVLASGEWRASFYHEYVEDLHDIELCATDQVRLSRRAGDEWRPVPLSEAPAVVFSEVMRDVDLFVGVTSVAADPAWDDRGETRYADYWHRVGFGDLTASAEVRRDALARILPRTRIAGRCSIEGRYLVVRGDLRTYKIHLGSANILMEPDDSYLCIVRSASRAPGKVFLPFEEDRLSVILSKAFLLAADTEIDDPSITGQIKRGA